MSIDGLGWDDQRRREAALRAKAHRSCPCGSPGANPCWRVGGTAGCVAPPDAAEQWRVKRAQAAASTAASTAEDR